MARAQPALFGSNGRFLHGVDGRRAYLEPGCRIIIDTSDGSVSLQDQNSRTIFWPGGGERCLVQGVSRAEELAKLMAMLFGLVTDEEKISATRTIFSLKVPLPVRQPPWRRCSR